MSGLLLSLFHEAVKVALVALATRPARAFQRAHVSDRIPGAGPLPHGVVCLSGVQIVSVQGRLGNADRLSCELSSPGSDIREQYEAGCGIQGIDDRHDLWRSTIRPRTPSFKGGGQEKPPTIAGSAPALTRKASWRLLGGPPPLPVPLPKGSLVDSVAI